MIKSGMAAILVRNPMRIKIAQQISKVPVKYAQKAGSGKPIFANRAVPTSSGRMYFCKPSERNIKPTARRQRSVGMADVLKIFFIFRRLKNNNESDVKSTKFLMKTVQCFYLFLLNLLVPNFLSATL